MSELELYELAKQHNVDIKIIEWAIAEMDDLYFNNKAAYDSTCSRKEIIAQMGYIISNKTSKIKDSLFSMIYNYPAPHMSHNMRDGRKKGEKLWFLHLGITESHKYSIFAKTEEELFEKVSIRLHAVKLVKLTEDYSGLPKGAFRCLVERKQIWTVQTSSEKILIVPELPET